MSQEKGTARTGNKHGPNDPVVPHPIHGDSQKAIWQLKYSILPAIVPMALAGCAYAAVVVTIMEYTSITIEHLEFLRVSASTQRIFVAFFLTLFLNTAFTSFRSMWGTVRSIQGRAHTLFLYLNLYLSPNDPALPILRDLIIAIVWSCLAPLDEYMMDEAKLRIRSLIRDDAEYQRLLFLAGGTTSNNTAAIGGKPGYAMIFMAQQKFTAAIVKSSNQANEAAALLGNSPVSQFNSQLLELRGLLGTIYDAHDDYNAFHSAYFQFIFLVIMLFLLAFPWTVYTESSPWGTIVTTGWFWFVVQGMLYLGCDMLLPLQGSVRINTRAILREIEGFWDFYYDGGMLDAPTSSTFQTGEMYT